MKNFIKKLLGICIHSKSKWMFTNDGIEFYDKQRYYDDYVVLICKDCGKILKTCNL